MNIVVIAGHIGRDAKPKTFDDGNTIYSFPVATNRNWRDKESNEKKTKTTWHNCVLPQFKSNLGPYLKSGTHVMIKGHIENRSYTKDDEKRTTSEIIVEELEFSPSQKQDNSQGEMPEENIPSPSLSDMDDGVAF